MISAFRKPAERARHASRRAAGAGRPFDRDRQHPHERDRQNFAEALAQDLLLQFGTRRGKAESRPAILTLRDGRCIASTSAAILLKAPLHIATPPQRRSACGGFSADRYDIDFTP